MKLIKKSVAILLSVLILIGINASIVYSNQDVTKVKTTISGISSEITALSYKELTKTVTINPCNGKRLVLLQQYNSNEKKYKTVNKYYTEDAQKAKLQITFPKEKRKKTLGKWKILVKENENALGAEKVINLISKSIVKKDVSAKAVCIYCVDDNRVIYDKNAYKQRKQASTTKLMTATLLIESGNLSKSSKISKKAANTAYSKPKMKAGDVYTNKALLHAMLIPSSNGAAVAIAEAVSGSTGKFVKKMNKKAETLGLKNTHYVTVHGLDKDNHYSSAYDTAYLTGYIYKKSKTFRDVIAKKSYKIKSKSGAKATIYTTDEIKDYSKKHKGGKTGHTSGAGYCFSGVYVHKNKTYVVCILGSKTNATRWSDMKKLYKYIDDYAATKY